MLDEDRFPNGEDRPDDEGGGRYLYGRPRREVVTSGEYRRSYGRLQRFVSVNVADIQTFEDLATQASGVGRDLRTILLDRGRVEPVPYGVYGVPDEAGSTPTNPMYIHVIHEQIGEELAESNVIEARDGRDFVRISNYQTQNGKRNFVVEISVGEDLRAAEQFNIRASDWRSGTAENYYPALHPDSANEQQCFARVLQAGVGDVLSVIPPPTQVPKAFNW